MGSERCSVGWCERGYVRWCTRGGEGGGEGGSTSAS